MCHKDERSSALQRLSRGDMSPSFGKQLKQAREAAGMSRKQLAARVGASNTEVGFWETDTRTPSDERQRVILAACRLPRPGVAALIAKFEADLAERVAELSGDLETLFLAEKGQSVSSPASDVVESAAAAVATRRRPQPTPSPRRANR